MDPTRWKRVEQVYHAALLRPPRERNAFLEFACADDDELRREVDSLLAQPSGDVLEAPAPPQASALVGDAAPELIGRRIGSYLIDARIGVGGMGEVYRARDTRLGRDVAIKVLPVVFATDPGRLARFEREARMLAALNHPRIATIHGLEELDGIPALVLELVEGPTLAERIARGPLGVDDALALGQQIGEALEAAHDKGIIHRDLKPANIKVLPSGDVKVLDFGLAKALSGGESGLDMSHLPTVTGTQLTGLIVGTPAYMSPEQARGHGVDKRTDIWAFGCVMYEMLAGRPPFVGDTISGTIAAILEREPAWDALPSTAGPPLVRTVRRCLEKDLRRRFRDIGDVRIDLQEAMAVPTAVAHQPAAITRRTAIGALIGAAAGAAGMGAVFAFSRDRNIAGRDVMRFPIALPPGYLATSSFLSRLAISPDGTHIACNAVRPGQSTAEWAVASRGVLGFAQELGRRMA
jgi:serine/threonine protein kinase